MTTAAFEGARTYAARRRGALAVRPSHAVRAALYVLLAGNLVRLPALTSGAREAPLLVNDLAVSAVLAIGALACVAMRRAGIDGPARLAFAFAAVGAASAVWAMPRFGLAPHEVLFGLAYLARWIAYFGLYLVVINGVRRDEGPQILATLERVILVFAVFGIVQSAFFPGFAQLVYPESELYVDWDPQGRRLVSTFLDPNFAGAFIDIGLLCALARLTVGERVARWRIAVLATALVLTASRGSMLAAAVGGVVIAVIGGVSRRVVRVATVGAVLLVAALPKLLAFAAQYGKLSVDASALARVISWTRALRILADNLAVGVGFNTYGFVQRAYGYEAGRGAFSFSLDGGLLFIAVMTGLVGTALYVAMLWRIGRRARVVWRLPDAWSSERAGAIAAVAVTFALVVHSLFVNSLLLPFLMEPLWLLWALPFAALRRDAGASSP